MIAFQPVDRVIKKLYPRTFNCEFSLDELEEGEEVVSSWISTWDFFPPLILSDKMGNGAELGSGRTSTGRQLRTKTPSIFLIWRGNGELKRIVEKGIEEMTIREEKRRNERIEN